MRNSQFKVQSAAPLLAALLALGILATPQISHTQTVAPNSLNFQGRIATSAGNPVPDGVYSVRFSLWNAVGGGTEVYSKSVSPLSVRNSTFAVTLDALPAGLLYSNLWLEIQIKPNAPLTPRIPLMSVPYAFKADLALTVPDSSITSAKISDGTLTQGKLAPDVLGAVGWSLSGNAGTTTANFIGTTNQPMEIRVKGIRALGLAAGNRNGALTSNLVYGIPANQPAGFASVVAGGGLGYFVGENSVNYANGDYSFVGGGISNRAMPADCIASVISGGVGNSAYGTRNIVIAGGRNNSAAGLISSISGGELNTANGGIPAIAGGYQNRANGNTASSVIVGGSNNQLNQFEDISAPYIFVAGSRAQGNFRGGFVWKSDDGTDFSSTNRNQFLISASGGVGINTNAPSGVLTLQGTAANARVQFGGNGVGIHQMSSGRDLVFNATGGQFMFQSIPDLNNLTSPTNQLYIATSGNAVLRGTLTQNSDARYKKNVATLDNALETILHLRGVSYQWKEKERGGGRQIGFIAQEVEKVLPELVSIDERGYKSVNYLGVVPVLVEAVKTLKKDSDTDSKERSEMRARLDAVERALAELKAHK